MTSDSTIPDGAASVTTSVRDGVALVTLDRPAALNALGTHELRLLNRAVEAFASDRTVRAVIVTGSGVVFCAGADIGEMATMSDHRDFRSYLDLFQTTLNRVEELPVPVIAAMNGGAFGGGLELALACDLRVLAAGAEVALPEIRLGALPGAGGTQRLAHSLPPAVYKRMLLLGESLSAADCARYGLVNDVVAPGMVGECAARLAAAAAGVPRRAVAAAKALAAIATAHDLKAGMEVERMTVSSLFDTADRSEGMRAFLDKRPAAFDPT